MPAAGNQLSNASKYSWVAPGPPCNSSTLMRGLFPTRLVQTRNVPLGVEIVIVRMPPDHTSSRPLRSKYVASVGDDVRVMAAFADSPARLHIGARHRMLARIARREDVRAMTVLPWRQRASTY